VTVGEAGGSRTVEDGAIHPGPESEDQEKMRVASLTIVISPR
jgi:hypothetical protein